MKTAKSRKPTNLENTANLSNQEEAPPLPETEGPKLQPFNTTGTIDFELIEAIGNGAHGYVVKIKIDDKVYALKVFLNQIVTSWWLRVFLEMKPEDLELLRLQWLPFHAECRAYGRLKETDNEHLAVKCHGYINLTDEQEKAVASICGPWWDEQYTDWVTPDHPQYHQKPRHAIVKDFLPGRVHWSNGDASQMARTVHALHHIGITVHDIKTDAYMEGKLVDFSKAVTVPHIKYDLDWDRRKNGDELAQEECYNDLASLDEMFLHRNKRRGQGPRLRRMSVPHWSYIKRLRKGSTHAVDYIISRQFNPRRLDWRKFGTASTATVAGKINQCRRTPRGREVDEEVYTARRRLRRKTR